MLPLLIMLTLFLSLLGCQSRSAVVQSMDVESLFHDELFIATEIISPEQIYSLPSSYIAQIKQAYSRDNTTQHRKMPIHSWLAQYIGAQNGGFEYRDHYTRPASETAISRQGNCMSLVVLSAALADIFSIPVEFQDIDVEPVWDKRGGFYLVNGHVNLFLVAATDANTVSFRDNKILIDFLPERAVRGFSQKRVNKQTLTAMYYNNIAAEALVEQQYDLAYALIKQAIRMDPSFIASINTLAVIYRHKGDDEKAEQAYRTALLLDKEDVTTLFNLALILGEQDRLDEWAAVHKILELHRINNPFYYYDMAQQAYFEQHYQEALVWYKRALEKADYRHEFYFGLSRTYWATGERRLAQKNMQKALALTGDVDDKRRYQIKLQAMKNW
ncbi:tetratricopeptide repeat protein [Shewanella sp. OMA3-2]|nr:tetratricopeptide repeat protein [Shewanella sp. OMA3-2]UJF23471.1 tetratricopeptide repeat protein [Shewanella sp. OMA3-2]